MKKSIIIILIFLIGFFVFYFFHNPRTLNFSSQKTILVNDNGFIFNTMTSSQTIDNFLQENKIKLSEYDQIIPDKNSVIYPGTNILIKRAVKVFILVDNKKIEAYTLQNTLLNTINEQNISLGPLDKISPDYASSPKKDLEIIITRINIEEKIIPEDIDFKIIYNNDSKLSWREEKIITKGEKGIREVKYKITYKDGKEISRVALEKNIVKEPTTQVVTKGTYIKLGKAQKGHASYYAKSWGELNASRSIPRYEFAKVTNLDNGKSTVVKINDYGPITKQRIIDLSYNSFAKIGNLGQGILHNVKVEQVLN